MHDVPSNKPVQIYKQLKILALWQADKKILN